MNNEWINGWREKVGGEQIKVPGCTSTSKNLEVALGFSKCHTKYENTKQPVLFIYSIANVDGFQGFRLTDKRFSVYPEEQEFLLMEGFRVYVLDIEEGFEILNDHQDLQKYHGNKVTVIYL